ncbi:prepilin-type cleavage/methylation protein [Gemella bergeri ATCC 700627]|uniref:Prepilin-type cleavage/methylation protein n=1 Tax=Gemella bergeri ATCC 700627 TaxID=1321820 RepID=U2QL24_9BACL|nr:type II secretion system protein [Gemella bergeri]ERK57216.1 prepilin-type cleavage/methylation protein [Gemella bergeri ATCC 700627]
MSKSKKEGFTLLELTISLFLLIIVTLLLMLILQTTLKTSKNFLDFTNYEYALAHKKIFQIYNSSEKVERESNYIIMKNKEKKEEVRLVFQGNKIYMEKQKNTNSYAGYILLLQKLKSYSIEQSDDRIKITIIDRENKKRILYLMLKNQRDDNKDEKEEDDEIEEEKF